MRKAIAGLAAGLVLGAAGTAGASTAASIFYNRGGIACGKSGEVVGCMRSDTSGYSVGISTTRVMVMNNATGKALYTRAQPSLP